MIERYARALSNLRVDRVPSRWPAATLRRAPHKPLLLLAVMDAIAHALIRVNFIELNAELIDAFDLYWAKVMGVDRDGSPALPFFHLRSDGFWYLVPAPGAEQALSAVGQIRSTSQLRQLVLGAKLDGSLFALLLDERTRHALRRVLIESYFAPDVWPKLDEAGQITAEAVRYGQELVQRLGRRFRLQESPDAAEAYHLESRSTAFRRVVVEAYAHTCAMCGIRVVTPEGRTAVAAAHIVPWSVSRNDDPRNGMALCGLHHWVFDQGLAGVKPDHEIEVSWVVPPDDERAEALLSLRGRVLYRPPAHSRWPARQALAWHWKHVFRSELPQPPAIAPCSNRTGTP